ncbi:MAG: fibrobacter succinogenes major paralogous domain-containing protein [Alistipes sp.]|nr:fibrobacter succinogenes major paralogous domain-containing protein [Alistipes sp.]
MTCYARQLGYYPAAGYRANGSGDLAATSTQGHYWSASQSADTLYPVRSSALGINSANVYPANQYQRAYGFSVRCVAAF